MVKKRKRKSRSKKVLVKPWFKTLSKNHSWGFVPSSIEGWVALFLLILLNVFAGNYFNLRILSFDNWASFGVVFFLSFFIFIMISRGRTSGTVKYDKL